ncbi:MAG: hypothetical protein SCALA702_25750 [Melioribacteraceae bacterium]|nr:MAG: hypothetical protein SCALA702_25750 [Melioribacteraceae bacterium]
MFEIELNTQSFVKPGFRLKDIPGLKLLSVPSRQIRNNKFSDSILADFSSGLPETGSNLVSNYNFSDGLTGWNKTGDWYMEEGFLKINQSAGTSVLSKTLALTSNTVYELRITIPQFDSGTLDISLGNSDTRTITSFGDTVLYIKSGATSDFTLTAEAANLTLSSITIKPVTSGYNGTPNGDISQNNLGDNHALYFDGANDFITFGNILNPREFDLFIFCWIKIPGSTPLPEKMEIFAKGSLFQFITVETSGYPGYYISSGNYRSEVLSHNIVDGNWHFLTLQHTFSNGTVLTLDNNITSIRDSAVMTSLENSDSLYAGKYPLGRYFNGYIGLFGFCLFDGSVGAPSELPDDIIEISDNIFRATKYLHR